MGTAIVAFTLSPQGDITRFVIVNSLGKTIDKNITQVFSEIEENWLPDSKSIPVQMYLPVTYVINGKTFFRIQPQEDLFIDEIIINASGAVTPHRHSREKLIELLYKFIDQRQHKKALRYADELIRRDPLNKEWYLIRSSIYKEMGDAEGVCRDLSKIRDFLQYPVDDKLFQTYCH